MQIPKPGNDRMCFHNVVNIHQILRRCTAIAQVPQEQQMTCAAILYACWSGANVHFCLASLIGIFVTQYIHYPVTRKAYILWQLLFINLW